MGEHMITSSSNTNIKNIIALQKKGKTRKEQVAVPLKISLLIDNEIVLLLQEFPVASVYRLFLEIPYLLHVLTEKL